MAMVRSVQAAVLLAMLGAGCALMPANAASTSLMGEWVVADVDHVSVTDEPRLTVAFDETGRIYGSAGCNRYTGAYSYDDAAGALKVTPLGVTRRLCPPALMTQEDRLVQSLQAATRVETEADGAVSLSSPMGRTLLRRPSKSALKTAAAATPAPLVAPAAGASTALPPPSSSTYALSGAPSDTPAPLLPPVAPTPAKPLPVTPAVTPVIAPAVTPATTSSPYALGPSPVSPRITAAGEVYLAEQSTLPPNATVRVQLRDVSRADAPATVLGQQEFSAGGAQPYPFSVTAPTSVIAPNARLTLFAQIVAGNRLLFISDTSNPVPVTGTATPLRIRVVNAAPSPTRTKAPAPAPVSGVLPANTSVSPPPAAAPNAVSWRCGAETFQLAFEDQVALLTTADGAVARLARINASDEPGAPQMFSNTILTVIRETEGAGRVRFARGRTALTTCAKGLN